MAYCGKLIHFRPRNLMSRTPGYKVNRTHETQVTEDLRIDFILQNTLRHSLPAD